MQLRSFVNPGKASSSHPVYLDNNATTPLAPIVIIAMSKCLQENYANPSSSHSLGTKARAAVDTSRKRVADLIYARPDEIIFTSCGSESNNMAILGTASRFKQGHIITSCIEHPAVANPLKHLESLGFKVTCLPVDRHGIIDADTLYKHIRKSTILITIMHANNETGSIQPIDEIGRIARKNSILFHCDAAQSVGKVPVNVEKLNVDFLTIVSHKFYGPKGVGALYAKTGTTLNPIIFGAAHEKGLRPGTENTCGIIGLGKACEIAKRDLKKRITKMRHLSAIFYKGLKQEIPGIQLNGHPSKRLPNTVNISFPHIYGANLLDKLKKEVAASTGSACHEGKHSPSPVLKAMGRSDEEALSSVRFSLGIFNSERQIRKAVKAVIKAYRNLLKL